MSPGTVAGLMEIITQNVIIMRAVLAIVSLDIIRIGKMVGNDPVWDGTR
jgi:hypothetical protein